jgi:hypothetical protein
MASLPWLTNHYQVISGRKVAPSPTVKADFAAVSEMKRIWFETVCEAFHIPSEYMVRARSTHHENGNNSSTEFIKHTITNVRSDMALFASAVFERVFCATNDELLIEGYIESCDDALLEALRSQWPMTVHWTIPPAQDIDRLAFYQNDIVGPNIV